MDDNVLLSITDVLRCKRYYKDDFLNMANILSSKC
jgi:hypothetical protein